MTIPKWTPEVQSSEMRYEGVHRRLWCPRQVSAVEDGGHDEVENRGQVVYLYLVSYPACDQTTPIFRRTVVLDIFEDVTFFMINAKVDVSFFRPAFL
jgi:valyl-tRNA synthetase